MPFLQKFKSDKCPVCKSGFVTPDSLDRYHTIPYQLEYNITYQQVQKAEMAAKIRGQSTFIHIECAKQKSVEIEDSAFLRLTPVIASKKEECQSLHNRLAEMLKDTRISDSDKAAMNKAYKRLLISYMPTHERLEQKQNGHILSRLYQLASTTEMTEETRARIHEMVAGIANNSPRHFASQINETEVVENKAFITIYRNLVNQMLPIRNDPMLLTIVPSNVSLMEEKEQKQNCAVHECKNKREDGERVCGSCWLDQVMITGNWRMVATRFKSQINGVYARCLQRGTLMEFLTQEELGTDYIKSKGVCGLCNQFINFFAKKKDDKPSIDRIQTSPYARPYHKNARIVHWGCNRLHNKTNVIDQLEEIHVKLSSAIEECRKDPMQYQSRLCQEYTKAWEDETRFFTMLSRGISFWRFETVEDANKVKTYLMDSRGVNMDNVEEWYGGSKFTFLPKPEIPRILYQKRNDDGTMDESDVRRVRILEESE